MLGKVDWSAQTELLKNQNKAHKTRVHTAKGRVVQRATKQGLHCHIDRAIVQTPELCKYNRGNIELSTEGKGSAYFPLKHSSRHACPQRRNLSFLFCFNMESQLKMLPNGYKKMEETLKMFLFLCDPMLASFNHQRCGLSVISYLTLCLSTRYFTHIFMSRLGSAFVPKQEGVERKGGLEIAIRKV